MVFSILLRPDGRTDRQIIPNVLSHCNIVDKYKLIVRVYFLVTTMPFNFIIFSNIPRAFKRDFSTLGLSSEISVS